MDGLTGILVDGRYLKVPDAARFCGVSRQNIYQLAKAGKLPVAYSSVQEGGPLLVDADSVVRQVRGYPVLVS